MAYDEFTGSGSGGGTGGGGGGSGSQGAVGTPPDEGTEKRDEGTDK